jgi:alpha-N-arabinofuranosidase
MRYVPQSPGDKAGLAAFQNARHYYLLSVTLQDGLTLLQLEKAAGDAPEVIASAPIEQSATQPVYLRIEADAADYRFSYALEPDAWKMLHHDPDGTILSTHVAGGFVGTYFGLHGYRQRL